MLAMDMLPRQQSSMDLRPSRGPLVMEVYKYTKELSYVYFISTKQSSFERVYFISNIVLFLKDLLALRAPPYNSTNVRRNI